MNKALKNTFSSVVIYIIILLLNVVTYKLVLLNFGSESNGLLSSVEQIFKYISLLEAGIGVSTVSALYSPLAKRDKSSVARVLAASRGYFRRSAIWYFLCVIVVSFVWPFVVKSELSYFTIWAVIFFQGVSGVIAYWFTSAIVNYLIASGKHYVNNNVHIFATFLTYGLKILICYTGLDVYYISLSLVLVNVIKTLFYLLYMLRNCPEFFKEKSADASLLKQRGAFVVHEISGVVFSGTDAITISVFCGLVESSIYTTYSMVLVALNTIIGQAFNGTAYILGNSYAKDKIAYRKTHDTYNSVYIYLVFVVFTVAYLLMTPFISLYTAGITDANYVDHNLPLLFVLIQLLSACRTIDNYLIRISYHAKQTINRSIAETVINLSLSVMLVHFIGIYGVLVATIVALLYRTNDMIIYGNKVILDRSPFNEYKLLIPNFVIFFVIVFASRGVAIPAGNYFELVLFAFVAFVFSVIVYAVPQMVLHRSRLKAFLLGCHQK